MALYIHYLSFFQTTCLRSWIDFQPHSARITVVTVNRRQEVVLSSCSDYRPVSACSADCWSSRIYRPNSKTELLSRQSIPHHLTHAQNPQHTTMPSTRLRPLHPKHSLRHLRTVFGPSSPPSSGPCSPLSASTLSSSRFSGFTFGNISAISLTGSSGEGLRTPFSASPKRAIIRRVKSVVDREQEEERESVPDALVSLVEPRPFAGPTLGGIEEVLGGEV